MEINFEVTQEMYLLLGKIERVVTSCRIRGIGFDNEEDNVGEYSEKLLSYVRATGDKNMMLECCKIDRAKLLEATSDQLYNPLRSQQKVYSVGLCHRCLFKVHNIALEKIWGIGIEDIENCKYCIDIYGKCYRSDGDKWTLIPKPGEENKQMNSSEQRKQELPDVLNTEEAHKYWEKAKEVGFIDDNFGFKGTKYQMAYFAELMSEKLKLKHKWKPFEELWKYGRLPQVRNETKERYGKVKDGEKIEKIFYIKH